VPPEKIGQLLISGHLARAGRAAARWPVRFRAGASLERPHLV